MRVLAPYLLSLLCSGFLFPDSSWGQTPSPAAVAALSGKALHVNPTTGDDRNDGVAQPVKTLARAVRLSGPGDTVHLTPGTYYESLNLALKHGEPQRPITVDGHGAVLDGSEPVLASEWESLGANLYRKVALVPNISPPIVGRWYFLWNGKMNRMGRCSKGPSLPLKLPADLQPGEWTYVETEDAFYLKLAEGEDLSTVQIRYPLRSSGVSFAGKGSHLVVKNITSTHVHNDGFNVHGAQRNLVFENIAAIECGDDGFSAHGDAECFINGFVSIGNATGICDVNESITHYKKVLIRDCVGHDLFFIGLTHSLEDAVIESRAVRSLTFDGSRLPEGKSATLHLKNVVLRRADSSPQEVRLGAKGVFSATDCSFLGLNFTLTPGSSSTLKNCFVGGTPVPQILIWANSTWSGESNVYAASSLRIDQTSFTPARFAEFQSATQSEKGSSWAAVGTPAPAGVGAPVTALEKIITLRPVPSP